MADPVLRLDSAHVSVEPGGQAQIQVAITSASSIVEGYNLDIVGPDVAGWARVMPPSLSVFPGTEASAIIVFTPPTGTGAASGTFPFGVRARSTEDPTASAVVEGDVTLGKVSGLQAKLVPTTSSGRWRGRHTIRYSNWGNAPVQLRIVASDPDEALGFYVRPDLVDLPLGGSSTVRMTVRTRKPFLRGTPVRLPFQVVGEPMDAPAGPLAATPYGDPSRPVVDGALNQKPILSKAFVTVLAVLLLAAIGGGAYAFTREPAAPTSLSKLGTPDKPENFEVKAMNFDAVQASWTPIAQLTGYELQEVDPADKKSVRNPVLLNAAVSQARVDKLQPATEYCYQLVAIREALRSTASKVACATTPKAPESPSPTPPASPSPTPTPAASTAAPTDPATSPGAQTSDPANPGGGPNPSTPGSPVTPPVDPFGNGEWVIVAGAWSQDSSVETAALSRIEQLKAAEVPNALLLDTNQYPDFKLTRRSEWKALWIAGVGPYPSREAAAADVARVQAVTNDGVFVVQPVPQ